MKRDSQRSKVYRAEDTVTVPEALERLETVEEMQAWVDKIVRTRWWRVYKLPSASKAKHRAGRLISYGKITVKDGRARRSASGWRGSIKMPKWSRTKLIVLHEVAHAIQTESPSHGRQYARIYLDLVTRFIGPEAGRQLKAAYVKHHVRSNPKRPTTFAGDPQQLIAMRAAKGKPAE